LPHDPAGHDFPVEKAGKPQKTARPAFCDIHVQNCEQARNLLDLSGASSYAKVLESMSF
jgi:hypothetical protein